MPDDPSAGGRTPQFLVFDVAGHRFGLTTAVLQEVTRAVAIAALPKAPPIVEGVINVRGAIVPVLDIRQRFGLPATALAPEQHFVLAQASGRMVALRVDRALDLVAVDDAAIESATPVAPGVEHVAGIATLPDGVLVIHDLDRFLSADEAIELDAVLARAHRAGEA